MSNRSPVVTLLQGREGSVLRRHPWIFSGAIRNVKGSPAPGDTVHVLDSTGHPLGWAAWSPQSQIRARMWTFDAEEIVDEEFFRRRISSAITLRDRLFVNTDCNAFRLLASEADLLPGVIIDRYDNTLLLQFLSAGAERWKDVIISFLREYYADAFLYERSDGDARVKEGLAVRAGPVGSPVPAAHCLIREHGLRFAVDIVAGHKTGFYLDQRDNRALLGTMVEGAEVLNCFSYTGAFAMYALAGGAIRVTDVDVSADALAIARRNLTLNDLSENRYEQMQMDVFSCLRRCRDEARQFDVIVLDPPKFATSKSQVDRAARGYKDINLLAMKLLRPSGLLFTFSCSGHIPLPLFSKIVADAAVDARRHVRTLRMMTQAPDHPMASAVPESWYLKGLLCIMD
ncbi:MAG: class I SAM-dependent methyltransferase [Bacteroidetes bacterium]|nr:class I SAM-dependent methyltransferase [Bacteroidota bacterium]